MVFPGCPKIEQTAVKKKGKENTRRNVLLMVNSALLPAFIFKIKEERAAVENVLKNGSKSTTCGWLFQVQRCERDRFESSKSPSLLCCLRRLLSTHQKPNFFSAAEAKELSFFNVSKVNFQKFYTNNFSAKDRSGPGAKMPTTLEHQRMGPQGAKTVLLSSQESLFANFCRRLNRRQRRHLPKIPRWARH